MMMRNSNYNCRKDFTLFFLPLYTDLEQSSLRNCMFDLLIAHADTCCVFEKSYEYISVFEKHKGHALYECSSFRVSGKDK